MKKSVLSLIAALAALLGAPAYATTATNTFNVSITLTSACEVVTVPTIAFTYTSFQTSAATTSSTFDIRCTNTKTITSVALDGTGTYTDATTNLTYSLSLSGVPATGTGAAQTVNISGTMASGQAGTCNAASCTNAASGNKTRTITITY